METAERLEFIKDFIKQNLLFVLIFSAGLMFLIVGVIQFLGQNSNSIIFEENQSQQTNESTDKVSRQSVWIDISGSVISPGVYQLPADSRLKDILVKAGGLASNADREYVSKNINLAKKLIDGEKIYIPKAGEKVAGISSSSNLSSFSSLININTASSSELDSLSGIGPVTAEKIINARPYGSIDELLSKKIVSQSVFEKIKEKITVY